MTRRVLVLCALVAAAVAAPQDDGIEDMHMRKFGAVLPLPVGTLNVPATGNGIIYQTPLGSALANAAANIGNGILNPINPIPAAGPAAVAAGLTTAPVIPFRPWNIFGNLFNRPTGAQAALLQDITTPGKPGLCPYVRRLLPTGSYGSHGKHGSSSSICGNLCHNDLACPNKTKCCPTECGYSCFDAVFIAENQAQYDYQN